VPFVKPVTVVDVLDETPSLNVVTEDAKVAEVEY
jgi:hypothetical protein